MCRCQRKKVNWLRSSIFTVFLLICAVAYPQYRTANDTIKSIPPDVINKITNIITLFSKEILLNMPGIMVPSPIRMRDKNLVFFDSLKIKASKNQLTKKLYSFVIVNPDTTFKKHFSGTSDASYIRYSGNKIRKIIIQRLNVFGADINNLSLKEPDNIQNLLNKTHFNTNESIIRKNLLFSEGDMITPLSLSDNERILRQLPYIEDARIIVVPVSDQEDDIIVYTKDIYSLGGSYDYKDLKKGSGS